MIESKFVIQVPSELFIEVKQTNLQLMSRQSQNEMHDLRLVEVLFFLLYICYLDSSLGQIDESTLLVYRNDLHTILRAHLQQSLDILNSFPGDTRCQDKSLPIIVFE